LDRREQQKRRFIEDAQPLANVYWFIRYSRWPAERRKHYRRALKEKARLAGLGYDREVIRLYRLWLKRPWCQVREKRFHEAFESPEQLTLF
jgi:hypothetical protein